MYKVFYNKRTVFFTENNPDFIDENKSGIQFFENKNQLEQTIRDFIKDPFLENLYVIHPDTDYVFKEYMSLYNLIEAAGGLVKNRDQQLLFIYRRNKWDLPKGKLEKNEIPETGALREIEEECGIQNLKIIKHIKNTYHTYELKGKNILKRTYWFEVSHEGNQKLKPQIEEEITDVQWLSKNDLQKVFNNTFPSIIEVIEKAGIGTGEL